MNQPLTDQASLLAQADLLLLTADLLRAPGSLPAENWGDALAQLDELLAVAGLAPASSRESLRAALVAVAATSLDDWSDEYHRLFDAAMICPPNQTAFVRRDKGAVIADLTGFYGAFGFTPRPGIGEKPDHIITELEFTAALLAMLAAAEGDPERQSIVRSALAAFATSHVNDWICIFAGRLGMVAAIPLFVAAAAAIADLWTSLAAFHALPRPEFATGDPLEEPESPYECSMAEAALVDLQVHGHPIPE